MSKEGVKALPEGLREWLDAKANERGVDRAEMLARAVAAARLVEDGDEALVEGGRETEKLESSVDALDDRVAAVEADLDEKIADVRERVIQVKRESDANAPADHDHPRLRDRAERAVAAATEAGERLETLEDRLDAGFDDYEAVLEALGDEIDDLDDLDEKLTRLAAAVVDLRSRARDLEAAETRREALSELRKAANELGVVAAKCGGCGEPVRVGLLAAPRCPHCERTYVGVEPARGFFGFGSASLTVGDPPALDGRIGGEDRPDDDRSPEERVEAAGTGGAARE
ncbi:CopG family transcriptional regulator [Halegenticoccus tardaugens]|uniref:CopG family transcriptional regulator n=1 Tax=Halegenticoccus tardaugens TaxID=2071624 RepID=UPI00100B7AB3|nr:CopG family transcriptional regulator [Halegenticoccus tardaugens]